MKLPLLLTSILTGIMMTTSTATAALADEHPTLNVWPGTVPRETFPIGPERDTSKPGDGLVAGKPVIRLGNVSVPTLSVFRPAKDRDTGAAVVIAPGGGYFILAMDLEGTEIAEWLNSIGVTGIVLKYRVPRRPDEGGEQPPVRPLQDAQRSISLVRSKAREWGIDPHRIGILGFSAGGHLAAETATNWDQRSYTAVDDADKESCRPDFTVLIYPAYLAAKSGEGLSPEIRVRKDTPQTFLTQTSDDPVNVECSVRMYLALKRAGVPAELHVYATGGHGYGLRPTKEAVTSWPQRCAAWLRGRGLLLSAK